MKAKPVVKYQTRRFKFAGKVHKVRSKLTLLATYKGALAKRMAEASSGEGLYWVYNDSKPGVEKLEIYEEKRLG